jgi:dienelactone hydrolase
MNRVLLWSLAGAAIIVAGFVINTARHAARYATTDDTPEERASRLAEHWRLRKPDGPGPFPAAILLSGCDGVRDNMDYWAGVFLERGRAALILDSHTPRNLQRLEAWRLVCAGQAMTGAERAGDIAVAIDALGGMADISGDVVILGASHGGWSTMEFAADAASGRLPPGLTAWPAPGPDLLARVSALVLLYPYCGLLNGADEDRWPPVPPSLMVLAEDDTIVDTPDCLERADALRAAGAEVETLVLPGADHGFDQRQKSAFSSLQFVPEQRDAARAAIERFLDARGL